MTHDRNGNGIVNVRVEHLAKPAMLTPPSTMYVVWFQQPGSDPENEGQLQVDNGLRGSLRTTTPLHNFDVFITAETDPTVRLRPMRLCYAERFRSSGHITTTRGRRGIAAPFRLGRPDSIWLRRGWARIRGERAKAF